MPKVYLINPESGLYCFHCPGCGYDHSFYTRNNTTGHVWQFNGNVEMPTVSPSLLVNAGWPEQRCHLFLRNGMIEYLSDCHHQLAGQKIECPEWEGSE